MSRWSRWRPFGAALSLSLCLTAASPADATVARQVSRAELVSLSDVVVRATVLEVRSAWNQDQTQILSFTRLQVTEYLKGSGSSELVLRQFGGEVDGLVSHIAGDPRFQAGQDVVLFLRQGDGVSFLTAMAQSAYFVQAGGTQVLRDLHGITFLRPSPNQTALVEAPVEPAEPLARLRDDVRRLAGGAR